MEKEYKLYGQCDRFTNLLVTQANFLLTYKPITQGSYAWSECRNHLVRDDPKLLVIVERYPNQTAWLAVRILVVKLSLYLTKN
jgi:hypothetical protein